jgi:hypothetical protein
MRSEREGSPMAQSVLEKVAGKRAGNYCTNPSKDVEVLERPHHCKGCGGELRYDRELSYFGAWVHVAEVADCRYASPKEFCSFCGAEGAEEGVRFRQHAWYDATECERCGGVHGFALGD